jgi:cytochrome c553
MRRRVISGMAAAMLLGGPALAQQTADVTVLAATCATCHGPTLAGAPPVPAVTGHTRDEIATQLRAFQSGERPATIMTRLAKGWSAPEIDALALKFGEAK